jgi:hypothetical protein
MVRRGRPTGVLRHWPTPPEAGPGEAPCVQCGWPIAYGNAPSDAVCGTCGTASYLRPDGQVGRYPGDWYGAGPVVVGRRP